MGDTISSPAATTFCCALCQAEATFLDGQPELLNDDWVLETAKAKAANAGWYFHMHQVNGGHWTCAGCSVFLESVGGVKK